MASTEGEREEVRRAIERYRERYAVRRSGGLVEVEGLTAFDLAEGLVRSLKQEGGG